MKTRPAWASSPPAMAARAIPGFQATQATPGVGERAALGYSGPWECTGRAFGALGIGQLGVSAPRLASSEFLTTYIKTRGLAFFF